ncbi:PAS domain-containing protein [Sphaerospermopsis aphanizomenoides BCCUSP55]|nr:PAS domain-containing protein [Sphaerospermopsis aphanizomenoides BCCUSP55]
MDLEPAISRHPLIIAPTACVVEAITLMSASGRSCSFSCEVDSQPELIIAHAQSSCVLVVQNNRLVGIVTERDLVRISAREQNLADLTISEVMVSPVVTLQVSEFTNLFIPLSIFQQHHIRHLPLVDDQGTVAGLVTHESLRQILRPIDLLHLRVASEVMTKKVVHAQPTATIVEITQLMTENRVSSVVIVAPDKHHLTPVGIITERDIVQFLALELDFATIQAQTVMSYPVFSVRGDVSLWSVRQLMQERQINRVVVTDKEKRLLGIVTQTNLLNVLNPLEIYQMLEVLEEKVTRLESDNQELLQAHNSELEQQVKDRTAALEVQIQRERLLTKIASQIRSSLNLQEILNTAVTEVMAFLKCDRLLVYQFQPDWSGIVVAESVGKDWVASINHCIEDTCFQERAVELYGKGQTIAIDNIHEFGYPECYLQLLKPYQVKANLVVPILVTGKLWGLLIGHHCADYRHWEVSDLSLLNKIAIQLAIAIQHAIAHQTAQAELAERQKAEAALGEKEEFLRSIYEGVEQAVFTVDVLKNGEFRFLEFNPACERLTGMLTEEMRGKPPLPAIRQHYTNCIQAGVPICYEECIEFQDKITWWITTLTPIRDTSSRIYRIVGTSTPITERKQIEIALRESQSRLAEAQRVAKIGNWEFDIETAKITWSAELFRILGRDPSLGEPTYAENLQLYHPEDAETLHKAVERSIYQGEPYQLLLRAYQPDGSFKFVEAIARAELNEQGRVKRLFGTVQDVHLRVQAERELAHLNQELEIKVEERTAALRESEERWQLALRGSNDGIWDFDLKTHKIFYSTRWKTMRGFNEEDIGDSPKEFLTHIHPDDYDRVIAAIDDHFAGKTEFFEIEYRVLCKDGSYLWILDRAQALRDESGQVIRLTGSETDISHRKQVEKQLCDLSERLELALNAAKIGIWEWDIIGDRLLWDQRMYELYGIQPSEFQGNYQAWENCLLADDLVTNRAAVQQAIAGEKDFDNEFRIVWPDGTIKVIKAYAIIQRHQGTAQKMIGVNFDMSDLYNELHLRKQAEAEMREMNAAMQNAVEGISRLDAQGFYISINPAYAAMCGYEPDEMIGMTWQNTVHPEDIAQMEAVYHQMLKTGKVEAEARGVCKDGTVFYKQVTMISAYNEQGEFIGNHCFMKDVSARKQAELALQESQQFIQQIADASPNILYLYDIQEQRNVYVNREIAAVLGYTPEQIQSMGSNLFQNLMHPDDLMRVPAQYNLLNATQDGEILEFEYRMQHANGEWRWLYGRDSVFKRDGSGNVKLTIGTAEDISDRKRLEQEQKRLIAILEASTDYIGMTDAAGSVLWNNAEFRRLLNVDSNASVKEKCIPNYHPEWALKIILEAGIPEAIANGTWVGETALLNAQREEIPVSQLIIAHKSPQGEVEFFSTILRDIRSRKEYEQRLERSNAELSRATRLKDEFLANMSHELRTPLNAILGLSESLQDEVFGVLNERQKYSLSTIERSGRHLLELINDILDVSKIEAGKLELEMSSVSISHLCKSSLTFVKQQAIQKGIHLNTNIQKDLGEIIVDERRMRQVLINLLNNAVKFTPSGGQVILEVHLESLVVCTAEQGCPPGEPHNLYSLCFSVIDTGIGIATTDLGKLFQPFMQIDSSLNRKYSGTGLGLTLVKQIVELHGASVNVTSELGQGSCFTVRLPYIPKNSVNSSFSILSASSVPPLALTTSPQHGYFTQIQAANFVSEEVIKSPLILIAEDNLVNIDTVSAYLEARGYQLILANNGREAINLATTHTPDLILMDIQMPEMDGLEAIHHIRANPQIASIPIIALTALAMPGDEEKCLQAGANKYLSKPVTLKYLTEMIKETLRKD